MNITFNESIINSKILVNYFKGLCKNFVPPYKDQYGSINRCRAEINFKITQFLSQIVRLINEGKCDAKTFKNEILNITAANLVHLETLWYLEVYDLISLHEIICYYEGEKNEKVIECIGKSLFQNILEYKSNKSTLRRKVITAYMKVIFKCKSDESQDKDLQSFLGKTVLSLISSHLQEYYKSEDPHNLFILENNIDLLDLIELFSDAKLDSVTINFIFNTFVAYLLQGSFQTIKSIFITQENSKSDINNKKVYKFFTVIFNYCELDDLMNQLNFLVLEKSKPINWNNMLSCITSIGMSYQDGWTKLKSLCDEILCQSFQKLDTKLLSFAFLIARQACFYKPKHCFPGYLQWFTSTFSTASLTSITSREICILFFNFLTDLIRTDSVYYLKVHLNRTPSVPLDCQSIADKYIALVKVQLCDLNASTDLGFCENSTEKSAATFDVENVISHFEQTNSILNSVFQASMFSKNYFENKFLVELLSKFEGKKSARHKIILKLNALGKIPKPAFKKYKTLEKNSR